MKIRQSFEQAICILLLIGASESPIKSHELSDKLDGFVLKKRLEDISFFDIFEAIEGKEKFVETTHLVEKVFDPSLKVKETEAVIVDHLNKAEEQYKAKLREITLDHILSAAHSI